MKLFIKFFGAALMLLSLSYGAADEIRFDSRDVKDIRRELTAIGLQGEKVEKILLQFVRELHWENKLGLDCAAKLENFFAAKRNYKRAKKGVSASETFRMLRRARQAYKIAFTFCQRQGGHLEKDRQEYLKHLEQEIPLFH